MSITDNPVGRVKASEKKRERSKLMKTIDLKNVREEKSIRRKLSNGELSSRTVGLITMNKFFRCTSLPLGKRTLEYKKKDHLFQNYTAAFDLVLLVRQPLGFGREKPSLLSHEGRFFSRNIMDVDDERE